MGRSSGSRRRIRSIALLAALVLAGACGKSSPERPAASSTTHAPVESTATSPAAPTSQAAPAGPCGTAASAPSRYRHVVWIWMENHRRDQVIGTEQAPFATELARQCGTATHYSTVGSPSLPNYLGATSGSIHGVHDDGAPAAHPIRTDNLFRQVRALGRTARTYAEAMPGPCALASTRRYAVKHNPAAYYVGGDDRRACATENLPLGTLHDGALARDLAAGTLPTFLLVVPDICNDTHDCAVSVGDRWLSEWVGEILQSPVYASGTTAVFVVWDEPTPMPFVAVAPAIRPGTTVTAPVDHYSLLRTTEEMLGIRSHLGAAEQATSMRAALGL